MPVFSGFCSALSSNNSVRISVEKDDYNANKGRFGVTDETFSPFKYDNSSDDGKEYFNIWVSVPPTDAAKFNQTYKGKKVHVMAFPSITEYTNKEGKHVKGINFDGRLFLASERSRNNVFAEAMDSNEYCEANKQFYL
jgi:hypothetical protein